MKRRRLKALDEHEQLALREALHRPWINLAERVGFLRPPYEDLRSIQNGFSDQMLFIVARAGDGDREAQKLRHDIRDAQRYWLLGEGPFPEGFGEMRRRFLEDRMVEWQALRRVHSPWLYVVENHELSGLDFSTPWPQAEEIFAAHALALLEPYGFSHQQSRSGKTFWKCWTTVEGIRVELDVDKGSHGVAYAAGWSIPGLEVSWHVATPFFYSGGTFHASKAHPFLLQLERFFSAYRLVFPSVWETLNASVRIANDLLEQMERKK